MDSSAVGTGLDTEFLCRNMWSFRKTVRSNLPAIFIIFLVILNGYLSISWWFQPSEVSFLYGMKSGEYKSMMKTVSVLTQAAQAANLTYFMYAGALLGSYRHHGLIPWDDDFDIMFDHFDKYRVRDLIKSLEGAGYSVYIPHEKDLFDQRQIWKFYLRETGPFVHKVFRYPYNWPFLDVFFFRGNETHIWDEMPRNTYNFRVLKSDVFPLRPRPYGDLMVSAPCNVKESLKEFDVNQCQTNRHNHIMELPKNPLSIAKVPCEQLNKFIPLVSRTYNNTHVTESLMLRNAVISSVVLARGCEHVNPEKHVRSTTRPRSDEHDMPKAEE